MSNLISIVMAPFTDPLYWAKRAFRSERATFYNDLAENMEAEPGTRITTFLSRYAERYPKEPIGKLSAHWLNAFREEGSFSEAVRGTVPDDDIGPIAISERAGELKTGLFALSEVIAGLDQTKEAMVTVFSSTILVFVVLQFYVGFYSFSIIPKIESGLPHNLSIMDIGPVASFMHTLSYSVRTFWPLWFASIIAFVGVSLWAVPNYIGRLRPWLDRHVLYFQLYREFRAAQFLTSLATITQNINNSALPIPQALQRMHADATPWVRWHIERILVNMEENSDGKGENFATGMVSKQMEYRMIDIAQYADMADMLDQVGKTILKRSPKEMERRAQRIQFISRVIMVSIVFGISAGFYYLSFEFQNAVTLNAYSR
ncbi:type II secretion system F family protein [Trinickia acidisoli]|uniref:type II secretion system F family protein n=1 Tax=Trinickia acidisoli TaxID=2767482 RepID=UPI001A8F4B4B|nr:type II secretion system F family protein [Trinickia acidisoli]